MYNKLIVTEKDKSFIITSLSVMCNTSYILQSRFSTVKLCYIIIPKTKQTSKHRAVVYEAYFLCNYYTYENT